MFPVKISEQTIELIHEKSLWILENLGAVFEHNDAVEIFRQHGARIDGNRVFINKKLAEKAISSFVPQFMIRGLNSQVNIGGAKTVFSSVSGITEIQKGVATKSVNLQDYIDIQKLHQTSEIVGMCGVNICDLDDLEKDHHDSKRTAYTLMHIDKPLIGLCGNGKTAGTSIEIAKNFFGYEDNYILGIVSSHSPLQYTHDDLEAIFAYGSENQPICITCCSMTGLSSPISIEGTVLQNNAEVLAGLIFIQLFKPGLPMIYGNLSMGFDMRYGCPTNGIETTAIIAYAKQMAKFYNIPCRAGGNLNDAKMVDYQAAQETCLNLVATLDNEIDFVYQSLGALNGLMQFSMEKFVLDEEIVQSILWLNNRKLLDVSLSVQDIVNNYQSGMYLNSKQTVKTFKKESFLSGLMNRSRREQWCSKGMPKIEENASQIVEKRLKSYQKPQMTIEQEKYLTSIINL